MFKMVIEYVDIRYIYIYKVYIVLKKIFLYTYIFVHA